MRTRSRLGRGVPVLLAALAVPGAVILTATPAAAATGKINSPTKGATITSDAKFDITASVTRGLADSATVVMSLSSPGQPPREIDRTTSGSDNELRYTFDPRCCGTQPAVNGVYTITLSGSSANDSGTFTLHVPPRPPSGVGATATGQTEITVTWQAGNEPDLVSYDLYEAASGGYDTVATDLPVGTTEYVVQYPSSGYGGDHTFALRAHRRACPDCSETVHSAFAQSPTVTLNEPTPEPEPEPSTNPGGGDDDYGDPEPGSSPGSGGKGGKGSGNGSGNGDPDDPYAGGSSDGAYSSGTKPTPAAAAQQRMAFGLTFKNFAPKLGAPKLPPLPKFAPAPIPEGTFDPSLPYGDATVQEPIAAEPGSVRQIMDTFVSTVFEGARLWRSIAWALILLLAAAHLRHWLRTTG